MEKVKHNQRFFIVNKETYIHEYDKYLKQETGERYKFITYEWVIPMYVYSISQIHNGDERFHLSPVNFAEDKNKLHDNWQWMREFKYDQIGNTIFNTEEEAWKYYDQKLSSELKEKYAKIHHLKELNNE